MVFFCFLMFFSYYNSIIRTENDDKNVSPAKSRKRTRNPTMHKSFIRKQKVQKGEPHYSASGKLIEGKSFTGQIDCGCKKHCADKIDILRQKELFDAFYAMENWTEETLFLRTLATRNPVRKTLNPIKNIRKHDFHSESFLTDSEQIQHRVCHLFLEKVLQISNKRIFRCLKSQEQNPSAIDFRGKFPSSKTKPSDIEFAKSVLRRLVTYESKYKMNATYSKYVHPDFNLKKGL